MIVEGLVEKLSAIINAKISLSNDYYRLTIPTAIKPVRQERGYIK